jgi:hypothetical protein
MLQNTFNCIRTRSCKLMVYTVPCVTSNKETVVAGH